MNRRILIKITWTSSYLCFDDCPKIIIFFMKLDVHILRGCGLKSYDSGVPGSFVILDVWRGGGGDEEGGS